MEWKDAKKQLLKNESRRKAYKRFDLGYWLKKKLTDLKIWWKTTVGAEGK